MDCYTVRVVYLIHSLPPFFVFSINELEQHMINWSSVLPYISRYTNEFDVEQIRKIPQMCA